jgi:hypothetical protein
METSPSVVNNFILQYTTFLTTEIVVEKVFNIYSTFPFHVENHNSNSTCISTTEITENNTNSIFLK